MKDLRHGLLYPFTLSLFFVMSETSEQTIAWLQQKIKDLELQLKKAKDNSGYWLKREEKPEIFEERAQNALPVLKEDKILLIDNKSDLDHIIIEWDNYHALSALNYTHKWKIDVIYIDPPYNTGNQDFVYNDNYVDPEDSYRHSKWLSFMNKRLRLSRDLLADDGVIFISIDDNEQSNLKLLCDDIFWENNLILVWIVNRPSEIATAYSIQKHEYCLLYAKDISNFSLNWISKYTISRWTVWNENQTMPIIEFPAWIPCYNLKDWIYNETRKITWSSENIENIDPITIENWKLKYPVRLKARWRSSNDMRNFFNNWCKPTKAKINWTITEIYFENDRFNPQIKKSTFEKLSSLYLENTRWSKSLEELWLKWVFNFPKSVDYIKYLLNTIWTYDSIILDFFAWSWTTWHAIIELNKQDWWHRQCILCSNREKTKDNPNKNICKDITYERVKRVLKWYRNEKWENVEWIGWWNLRYYTTEFIQNKKSTDDLRQSFIYLCDELLCIKEDTFNEYKSEFLSNKLRCYHKNNHYTVILYDIREMEKLQNLISKIDGEISVYIFSLSWDSCEEELQQFSNKITIENIPDDILETYKKIF